jgi:cell division protein FtsI/penicillin-binding protein 2
MTGRFKFTQVIFVVLFLVLLGRLFYWQFVRAEELQKMGESQYGRIVNLKPERGEIKTSDGYPIATNKISYLVYANPKEVKDKKTTAQVLSRSLGIDIASASANLSKNLFWVPIKHGLTQTEKETLEKLKLRGVGFEREFTRFYPEASLSAHLIGFVGKDESGKDKGYFGIEGFYDRLLSGKEGKSLQVHDAFGRPILAEIRETSPIEGSDLILSVDRSIQFLVEKELKEGIERYGAQGGMAAVMDPKTGNILAMASFPSFDPRSYWEYDESLFKNPLISNLFEPGSTFKPLIMSAALDSKVVEADTKCNICSGPVFIGGHEIKTWNNKYYKNTTMVEVIQHSDNTGMVFVSQKLGLDRLLSYLKKFGIGDLTGIDLQGEVAPGLRDRESWYKADLAAASFGQGISITAMELLSATSAIANEGKRMEPHVVSAIESQGQVYKIRPKIIGSPIESKTAKLMSEIMVNAVNKGEAQWTRLKGYRIAGKTGTASIPFQGKYDPENTIPSFVGFGPADNPKFVALVVLIRPKTSIYGSETAAPIFFSIARDILSYYKIPPQE